MSSMTIFATFTLAMPMKERAPVWSVMTPMLAGRSVVLVIGLPLLRPVRAEQRCALGLAAVTGGLEDRRDLGVRHEGLAALFIPVEQGPDPVVLGRVAHYGRPLGAGNGSRVGARGAEHLQEAVNAFDSRRGQKHHILRSSDHVDLVPPPNGRLPPLSGN